jgi:hypothetical protein
VPRRIFGPRREEGRGKWRWAGHRARIGKILNAHKMLTRKSQEQKPFGRHGHRCKTKIKIDLK